MAETIETPGKLIVSGNVLLNPLEYQVEGYELVSSTEISISREADTKQVEVNPGHLAQVVFEDGTEWIGYAGDVPEIFEATPETRSLNGGVWVFPASLQSAESRSLGSVLLRVLNVFTPKTKQAAQAITRLTDHKIMPRPGFYVLNRDFSKSPYPGGKMLNGKVLLLLHGTLSSTDGSFGDLKGRAWNAVFDLYDHVLALDHYTLSVSPFQNAEDLLKELPDDLTFDILSQSRGGLIGDILARCDRRNSLIGFSEDEIELMGAEDPDFKRLLGSINLLARGKSLKVDKFVRVACPAGGTTLLSNRLDHFLNALLTALGLAVGSKLNPLYNIIKEFLMGVLSSRADAKAIPGLWAMVPSSAYQKINNRRDRDVTSKLYVIAGDGKVGGSLGNTLLVIFSNLFYRADNDLVVDTKSMKRGLSREQGLYQYLSRDSETTHFSYFKKENTQKGILCALQDITNDPEVPFERITRENIDRGIRIQIGMASYSFDNVTGKKPIALMLPGIMGSTLRDENGEIWMDFGRIHKGHFVSHLYLGNERVTASGVMAQYYKDLSEFLLRDHDLKIFAFDWRKSLTEAAKDLEKLVTQYLEYGQPINIIAHSMGGLVIKKLMVNHQKTWSELIGRDKSHLFLLGTPWRGSHLIMEVLTGHSKRIKQLNFLDFHNSKDEILNNVYEFPGVFELLPLVNDGAIKDHGFGSTEFWKEVERYADDALIPDEPVLKAYEAMIKADELDLKKNEKIFYIAGHDDTVFQYKIKKNWFTGKEKLVYEKTNRGDGSVTWALGVPATISAKNVYYSPITHGELANAPVIFETINDLIRFGTSQNLPNTPPVSRSGEIITEADDLDIIPGSDQEAIETIFGISRAAAPARSSGQTLSITVSNADLKNARHPVMVGHFRSDGIYSAEKALDGYLGGRLSERHRLAFYPGEVGESEITYHSESTPKGGLVVGLGDSDKLTPYRLSLSVEKAIIKYAFFFRDNYSLVKNKNHGSSISSVIIGNSFAGLPVSESIIGIITGIQRANEKINHLNIGLNPIRELEFIDYYEDLAQLCYQTLRKLEEGNNSFNITVNKFQSGPGKRKRFTLYDGASWWHTFTTAALPADEADERPSGLAYTSSSGKARVEQNTTCSDLQIVEHLSAEFSHLKNWEHKLSKTMFELLVPNDFKSVIRNQNNIVWKMDEYSAQFPWEMFHNYTDDPGSEPPTFVNTGLIRQLITGNYQSDFIMADTNKAIVIGDPDYSGTAFSQLPGAADEATLVSQIIRAHHYSPLTLINRKAAEIIKELFSGSYKIMHFAAHGVYETLSQGRFRAGVVLGNGVFLEPCTVRQLPTLPEFVFINCCYSGTMTPPEDKYYKYRTRLAANIGTQFIRMGVKAVVVTGWAVDDAAAKTFAKELYDLLFAGYEFGTAVQRARKKCYELHPHTNTWGAYQCYGDHFYRLVNKNPQSLRDEPFVTATQARTELENLLSLIKEGKVNVSEKLEELNRIQAKVEVNRLENAEIKEFYAKIYAELGNYAGAVRIFEELLTTEKADFSVTSLEQYCSLRSKLLVARVGKNEQIQEEVTKLIKDLEVILLIGKTSERLALMGSIYKRAAIVSGIKDNRDYLEQMKEYFKESFVRTETFPLEDRAYALSNYLLAEYALYGPDGSKELNEPVETFIKERTLDGIIKQLTDETDNFKDYYKRNAVVKVLIWQYLKETKASKLKDIFENLKKEMIESIRLYANMKHILGEKEQLEFIIDLVVKDKAKKRQLENLKREVETWLGGPDR